MSHMNRSSTQFAYIKRGIVARRGRGDRRRAHGAARSALYSVLSLTIFLQSTALAGDGPCGGKGERACCCFGDGRCCAPSPFCGAWDPACHPGLKEITVPACGVGVAPSECGGCSSSWCAESTPCGGVGQRACCSVPSCNPGLIEDFTAEGSCSNVLGAENCACEGGVFLSLGTCRDKKGVGEVCNILTPCEDGLVCRSVSATQSKCFADLDGAVSTEQCLSFFDRDVLDAAVNAAPLGGNKGESLFFGYGGAAGFVAQASNVRGVVYGRDGCYGCYHTQCTGIEFSVGFSGLIEQGRSSEHLECPGDSVCSNARSTVCSADSDCTGGAYCSPFACSNAPRTACAAGADCPSGGTCKRCNSVSGQSFTQIVSAGTGLEFVGVSETLSYANCSPFAIPPPPQCELVGSGESVAIGVSIAPPLNLGFADCSTAVLVAGCLNGNGDFIPDVSNTPPTCSFTSAPTLSATCSTQTSPAFALTSTSSDSDGDPLTYKWTSNCPGASFTAATSSSTNLTVGWPMCSDCFVTLQVSDGSETVNCTPKNVAYVDLAAPIFSPTASNQTVECDGAGNASQLSSWTSFHGGASATDACGSATWTNTVPALSDGCGATGSTSGTFKATDNCGNFANTSAIFTIQDTTAPTINPSASNQTVECDGAGNVAQLNSWLASHGGAGASDVCSGVSWSSNFTGLSDECGMTGSALVQFTATDACTLASNTSARFTIADRTKPAITCPADATIASCDECEDVAGIATATDVCDGAPVVTHSDDVVGTCPRVTTRTWTARDACGNESSCTQRITCVPPSVVSNTERCLFDVDNSCPEDLNTFRLLYTTDPKSPSCYWMPASNPGQFFYNVFDSGTPGDSVSYTLAVPYPFVTQGSNPVHAYDGVDVYVNDAGQGCFTPGNTVFVDSNLITLASYSPQAFGSTSYFTVSLTMPASGFVFLAVHLDYGLRSTVGYNKDGSNNAVECGTTTIEIPDCSEYDFSVSGDATGGDTVQSKNSFKKNPGVAGFARYAASVNPVPGYRVRLINPQGEQVGQFVTDADGFYSIVYRHTGSKSMTYLVILTDPSTGAAQAKNVTLKASGYGQVDFLVE